MRASSSCAETKLVDLEEQTTTCVLAHVVHTFAPAFAQPHSDRAGSSWWTRPVQPRLFVFLPSFFCGRGRLTCYSYDWGSPGAEATVEGVGRGVPANYCDPATATRTLCDEGVRCACG